MKLKERPGDFRVIELLREGFPQGPGPHRVYRVTKLKQTTFEVVERMAHEAGVEKREVSFAGLKDRQGVTVQYVSVRGGKLLALNEPGLIAELVGESAEPVDADCVRGNAFDVTVRALSHDDLEHFDAALPIVREQGVPNYFDDQRFGALRHGQGFLVREMIEGRIESALMRCLLSPSAFDPPREAAFKGRLRRAWGDFEECVKLCRGGLHISVFRHLARNPEDFAGAWRYVAVRIRLIHLYAYQSYLWNRTVAAYLRQRIAPEEPMLLPGEAGALPAFRRLTTDLAAELASKTIPLLAPDVVIEDPEVKRAVDAALAEEGLTLEKLVVPGVEGFAFKAEERPLLVVPRHLRVLKPERDECNPGFGKIRIRFELPRGSYATLVAKRLFARRLSEAPAAPRVGRKLMHKPPPLRESGILPDSILRRGAKRRFPPRAK